MKSLAKIGLGTLLGAAALFTSASFAAPNLQAQADLDAIQKIQAVAKAENDRIKLNCVNDKFLQGKVLVNIIEAKDKPEPKDLNDLHELRVAAENCVGKKQINLDNSNSYTSPPGVSYPTDPGNNDWGTFEPPLDASSSTPSSARTTRRH